MAFGDTVLSGFPMRSTACGVAGTVDGSSRWEKGASNLRY